MLISAASFYATYLQAQSSERQVKAATWPYLYWYNGNYDIDRQEEVIQIKVQNLGVGPAMIKSFSMRYDQQITDNFYDVLLACCGAKDATRAWFSSPENQEKIGFLVTARVNDALLAAGNEVTVVSLEKTQKNGEFWQLLNNQRWKVEARACYCSLLDQCYVTDFENDPIEVNFCPDQKALWDTM